MSYDSEHTERTLLTEIDRRAQNAEAAVTRVQFWVKVFAGLAVTVFLAGMAASRYLASIAHMQQLSALENRVTIVETQIVAIKSEVEWLRRIAHVYGMPPRDNERILALEREVAASQNEIDRLRQELAGLVRGK
jgi:hypothetical protein